LDTLLHLLLGVSLSAACGFRIFVPFLAMSVAALSGNLTLASGFEWIGTPQALAMFAIATCLEVAAYYLPWVDNALDTVATPTAIAAGTLVTAAQIGEMSPMLQWTLAAIVGGGAATVTQGLTDIARLGSTASTGGLANPLLSTMELGTSAVISIMALTLPIFTAILILGFLGFAIHKLLRFFLRKQRSPSGEERSHGSSPHRMKP